MECPNNLCEYYNKGYSAECYTCGIYDKQHLCEWKTKSGICSKLKSMKLPCSMDNKVSFCIYDFLEMLCMYYEKKITVVCLEFKVLLK